VTSAGRSLLYSFRFQCKINMLLVKQLIVAEFRLHTIHVVSSIYQRPCYIYLNVNVLTSSLNRLLNKSCSDKFGLPDCEFMCRGITVINSSATDNSPIDDIVMFTLFLIIRPRLVLIYHIPYTCSFTSQLEIHIMQTQYVYYCVYELS